MLELALEDFKAFDKSVEDLDRSVVAHHLTTLDDMTVAPNQCPAQQANRCALLLIGQHLNVGKQCGVVDRHMDPVVSEASRAALLPIACDVVPHLADPGKLLKSR